MSNGLTVEELIELLSGMDQDAIVLIDGERVTEEDVSIDLTSGTQEWDDNDEDDDDLDDDGDEEEEGDEDEDEEDEEDEEWDE